MSEDKKFDSKYSKPQRIAALVCVILIVIAFIATLVLNLIGTEWSIKAGRAALGCIIVIPVLAWVYIWLIGHVFHKHTIADFDFFGNPTDHSPSITQTDSTESPEEENE